MILWYLSTRSSCGVVRAGTPETPCFVYSVFLNWVACFPGDPFHFLPSGVLDRPSPAYSPNHPNMPYQLLLTLFHQRMPVLPSPHLYGKKHPRQKVHFDRGLSISAFFFELLVSCPHCHLQTLEMTL